MPKNTRLIQLLAARDMRQAELAKRIGKDESLVSLIVNGKTSASVETWVSIADVLGVSVDYLLGRSGERRDDSA